MIAAKDVVLPLLLYEINLTVLPVLSLPTSKPAISKDKEIGSGVGVTVGVTAGD